MKLITKLLSTVTMLTLACPLLAQGIEKATTTGSELIHVSQAGMEALGKAPQVGATLSHAAQAGVNASMRTSQAAAEALRASQIGMPEIVGLSAIQIEKPVVLNLNPALNSFKRADVAKTLQERVDKTYEQARQVQAPHHDLFGRGAPLYKFHPIAKMSPIFTRASRLYPNAPFLAHRPWLLAKQFAAQENRDIISQIPRLAAWKEKIIANIPNFKQSQWWYNGFHGKEEGPMMENVIRHIPQNTSYLLLGYLNSYGYADREIFYQISVLLRELRWQQPDRKIILVTDRENDMIIDSMEGLIQKTAIRYRISTEWLPCIGKYKLEDYRMRTNNALSVIEKLHQEHPEALIVVYSEEEWIRGYQPFSLGAALRGPDTFAVSFTNDETSTWFDQLTNNKFKGIGVLYFDESQPELTDLFGVNMQVRTPYRMHSGRWDIDIP